MDSKNGNLIAEMFEVAKKIITYRIKEDITTRQTEFIAFN